MNQTQKMKIDPTKPWPFPVVFGVAIDGVCSNLSQFDAVNTLKCRIKYTKEPKCRLYDTFEDLGEPLF